MRILAVSPYYDPEGGGLERYNHQLLRRLAARGHDVAAIAFTRHGPPRSFLRNGVTVHLLEPRWLAGNTPLSPSFHGWLTDALRRDRPDIVWAHTPVPFAAEMAYLAARRTGIRFAATFHAGQMHGSSPLLEAAARLDAATLHHRMVTHADLAIAVSPYVRDHLLARRRDAARLVPPGVDRAIYHPNGAVANQDILFVGPLDSRYRWKGIDTLWRAFMLLHHRLPAARLILVGAGDRLAEFQRCARCLPGAVLVRGRLPEPELAAAYREAAVTVLPSTTDAEAFGMVLAEANASGRPVVGSAVGGIPDFIRPGDNGLLARPGDPRDLADKLETLLAQPDLARQMGRRGLQRVAADHDWDTLALRTETFLEEAALARPPRAAPAPNA